MEIRIGDRAVVPYPEKELDLLREYLKNEGMYEVINDNTGISKPTIKRIADDGRGRFSKVNQLREFIKSFKKAIA